MKRSVSRGKTKKVKKMKRVKSSNVYKSTTMRKESKVKFAETNRGIDISSDLRQQPPQYETKNLYINHNPAAMGA